MFMHMFTICIFFNKNFSDIKSLDSNIFTLVFTNPRKSLLNPRVLQIEKTTKYFWDLCYSYLSQLLPQISNNPRMSLDIPAFSSSYNLWES